MTTLVVSFQHESGTTEAVTTIFSRLPSPDGAGGEYFFLNLPLLSCFVRGHCKQVFGDMVNTFHSK